MGKTIVVHEIGGGSGGGAVDSWKGRTGAVVPLSGDYTTGQVTEVTNKRYVTDAEKAAIGTGEANTSSNEGGGETLALPKSGINLPFRSLLGTNNINIVPSASGHELEISSTITTAGILARVFYTADPEVLAGGSFIKTALGSRGTINELQQQITVDDDEKDFFAQDVISAQQPVPQTVELGQYVADLIVQTSSNSGDQRFTIEVYAADADGNVIDSGLASQPVGDLGVKTVGILDSGVIDLQSGNPTSVPLFAFIAEPYTFATGTRARYHISGEKVGVQGGSTTLSLFTGANYNSYIDLPVSSVKSTPTTVSRTAAFSRGGAISTFQDPYLGKTVGNGLASQPFNNLQLAEASGGEQLAFISYNFGYSKTGALLKPVLIDVLVYNKTQDGQLQAPLTETSLPSAASWKVLAFLQQDVPANNGASIRYDGGKAVFTQSELSKISDLDPTWTDSDEYLICARVSFSGQSWATPPEDVKVDLGFVAELNPS
jgi:hypothetical protein